MILWRFAFSIFGVLNFFGKFFQNQYMVTERNQTDKAMSESVTKRPRGRPKSVWREEQSAPVQALDRGLLLMNALARTSGATLTELSLSVGIPASSAHRLLGTLQRHGYVDFDETDQTWSIGLQAFQVGAAFSRRADLITISRQVMQGLMEETGETANLALPDRGDVVFVNQVETTNPIRAFFRIGARGPMHATGIGKALLAEMSDATVAGILEQKGLPRFTDSTMASPKALFSELAAIRERGWSIDDEEHYEGMRCVAAVIRNAHGEAVAGVSVSGPKGRVTDDVIAENGPKVRRAAEELSRLAGGVASQDGWTKIELDRL